jgi:hypothetical protein
LIGRSGARSSSGVQQRTENDRQIADLLTRFATCTGAEIDAEVNQALILAAVNCGADHAFVTQPAGDEGT